MNSYPLRIPISELPDETTLTIPRKAWTLWGTECKLLDIDADFCRLEFYPEGHEVRRNQEVFVEIDGVSIKELHDVLISENFDHEGMVIELGRILQSQNQL